MSDRPRFQQAVYDEGHTDGRRAGFKSGETYGRWCQRNESAWQYMGSALIGLVLGASIQPLVFWIKGVCW